MLNFIKDLLAPKKCYSCNEEWHFLCKTCFENIEIYSDICHICKDRTKYYTIHNNCKKNEIYYDKMIILNHYSNKIIKKLILDSKFNNKKDIIDDFSIYLWKHLLKNIWDLDYSKKEFLLISVPMFFLKKYKRWYNITEIICSKIWKNISIDYNKNIINKIKNTCQQSQLSSKERKINLKNAFKLNKKELDKLDKKVLIIVDDVVSTWSTINEIAKLFKNHWEYYIIWLTMVSD